MRQKLCWPSRMWLHSKRGRQRGAVSAFGCATLHHEIVERDMHTKLEMLINMFCTADTRRYPHILGGSVYISVNCSPAIVRTLSHHQMPSLSRTPLEIIKLIFIRRQAVKNSWDGWTVGWLDRWMDGRSEVEWIECGNEWMNGKLTWQRVIIKNNGNLFSAR